MLSLGFELPALRARLLVGPAAAHVDLTDNPDSILRALGNQALASSKAGRAAKVLRLLRMLQLLRALADGAIGGGGGGSGGVAASGADANANSSGGGNSGGGGNGAREEAALQRYRFAETRVGQKLSGAPQR